MCSNKILLMWISGTRHIQHSTCLPYILCFVHVTYNPRQCHNVQGILKTFFGPLNKLLICKYQSSVAQFEVSLLNLDIKNPESSSMTP